MMNIERPGIGQGKYWRQMTKTRVLRSVNNDDATRCVDIFVRPDGSFGYEEYRRDPEDPRGWGGAAGFGDVRFDTSEATITAALGAVPWLNITDD